MVIVILLAALLADTPADPVRPALEQGKFPWYNAATDSVQPVWPPVVSRPDQPATPLSPPSPTSIVPSFEISHFVLWSMGIGIGVAVAAILWSFWTMGPRKPLEAPRNFVAGASRMAELPADLPADIVDPWPQVEPLRDAGRLSEAIIALYVHLLLTLNDRELILLAPGKTGRQLVRSISDRSVRDQVEPTLRLFEAAFYGHHAPNRATFDDAWTSSHPLHGESPGRGRA